LEFVSSDLGVKFWRLLAKVRNNYANASKQNVLSLLQG